MEEIITHLEMTDPNELNPARPVPEVELELVDRASPLIRSTQNRVAAPHHWRSLNWSREQWERWLAHPHRRHWIIRRRGEIAGLAALEPQPEGQLEIATFGLVPEQVGQGMGGHALTLTTELAWRLDALDASAVRRVWLHTSSFDHPHALPNYLKRGFRPFQTETRQRDDME